MYIITSTSESLVTSLCREVEFIRVRSKNISQSLRFCQNDTLSKRLLMELDKHQKRCMSIFLFSKDLITKRKNNLSVLFLIETTERALQHREISL